MEKKIEDYLHLYLGCNVITTDDNEIAELIGVVDKQAHLIHGPTGSYGQSRYLKFIKLILRLLSDITDDEWGSIEGEMDDLIPDVIGYNMVKDNFIDGTDKTRMGWQWVNQALIALRKRGVDVDDLIESGLAIDAKTLTNQVVK